MGDDGDVGDDGDGGDGDDGGDVGEYVKGDRNNLSLLPLEQDVLPLTPFLSIFYQMMLRRFLR